MSILRLSKKIPNKIEVLGHTFKVVGIETRDSHAKFNFGDETISINMMETVNVQCKALLHEVMEIIMHLMGMARTHEGGGETDYLFDMFHIQSDKHYRDDYSLFVMILFDTIQRNNLSNIFSREVI